MTPKRIAIVGGGISGLSAAYHLAEARRSGTPIEEHLFEAGDRLGGVIRTEEIDGCVIEAGPDSFLTEKREALDLCERLALVPQLIGSLDEHRRTLIVHHKHLVPLPDGFEFMVPTRPLSVFTTRLLSWRDKLGLVGELFHRPRPHPADESVASFVTRHFGQSLLDNIVDPLLTAVYGGDAHRLSAPAILPRLVEVERKWGSLSRGLRHAAKRRKKRAQQDADGQHARPPLFTTLRDGLGTLVTALRMNLDEPRIHCGRQVVAVRHAASESGQPRYVLSVEGGESFAADAVILALPARQTGHLLHEMNAVLAEALTDIHYSSSLIVAVGYEAEAVGPLPAGFGFLVPRNEPFRLRACTFVGQKFPWRVPANRVLLRCFLGGMGDETVLDLSDAEITAQVRRELEAILGLEVEPVFMQIYRWPKAMAQYTLGHQKRIESIQALVAHHRLLYLCGNAYGGIGVPDCIRSGRLATEQCVQELYAQRPG